MNIDYYVIHLERSKDRLINIENMQNNLKQNIKIFNGIDGYKLKIINNNIFYENNNIEVNLGNNFDNLHLCEIGTFLSHLLLYKEINDNSKYNNYSVIFEDDFYFENNFLDNKIKELLNQIDIDFDLLYLGNLNYNKGDNYKNDIYFIDPNNKLYGCYGYIIKNKNISKIYEKFKNLNDANDSTLKKLIDNKELNGLVLYPSIISQNYKAFPSTFKRNNTGLKKNLLFLLQRRLF